MAIRRWLALAAVLEAATGIVLIIHPPFVVQMLLGGEVFGAGVVLGRVGGFALLSFGLACWPGWDSSEGKIQIQAVRAMFAYNFLITFYLIYLGAGGQYAGILLWPVVVLHAVLALLFARACRSVKF